MKIPVLLPVVRVRVGADGALEIDVDGAPHASDRTLHRADLRLTVDEIAASLDSPVRVEVREPDDTMYADIVIPQQSSETEPAAPGNLPGAGVNGTGFRPGEEIAVAYVFARQTADNSGRAALRLPACLLASRREGLVLLGLTSSVIASID